MTVPVAWSNMTACLITAPGCASTPKTYMYSSIVCMLEAIT